jgi:hypothetical protein
MFFKKFRTILFLIPLLLLSGCGGDLTSTSPSRKDVTEDLTTEPASANSGGKKNDPIADSEISAATDSNSSRTLFDGKTLANWQATKFGGSGEVSVADGAIVLAQGYPLTGVTTVLSDLPNSNYELELEAKRMRGSDFFCGITFPVNDSHCTLIAGGWGGALVGLSCIDGFDASANETRQFINFESNRWYRFRIRVRPSLISVWIDDGRIIEQDIAEREISVRAETLPSRPLGICSFETKSALRKIRLSLLSPASSIDQ